MGLVGRIRDILTKTSDESEGHELPHEILYIDESRLDSYFEQISDPVVYDEVSETKIKTSLTNLSSSKQVRKSARDPTTGEKVSKLIDIIERGGDDSSRFQIESCVAKRGHVPAPDDDEKFDDLWVWVSTPTQTSSGAEVPPDLQPSDPGHLTLILIEETHDPAEKPRRFTGCSTLQALLNARVMDPDERVLDGIENTSLDPSHQGFQEKQQELGSEDAISVLSNLGAEFGRRHFITTIYTRELIFADENNDFATTVFGYPIIILGPNK